MELDIYSVVLSLVMIAVGYYVIRKLPNLIAIVISAFVLSFVLLFVTRDMLHLPVNDYVDTSAWDDVTGQATDYVDDKFNGRGDYERSLTEGDGVDVVDDGNVIDEIGKVGVIDPVGSYKYLYEEYGESERIELLTMYAGVIDDRSFKAKLLGMNPYVDMKFDLGNAKLYNSEDSLYFIIEFKD